MLDKKEDKYIRLLTADYCRIDDLPAGRRVELDLGCGKGSFTTQLAGRYPERLILAADVMIGRLRSLVKRNEREGVENIRALRVEARMLLGMMLPDSSLHRLHILCPDPWPKERHRANRLLCADFMGQIHRVLEKDGMFHFSTDDIPYLEAVERVVLASGLFEPFQEGLADIADIRSDFERRWTGQGKGVAHLLWRRRCLTLPDGYRGH